MTSYLSGKICPLTPSTKPCNVDHLAKKTPSPVQIKTEVEGKVQTDEKMEKDEEVVREETEQVTMGAGEDDTDMIKVDPIAIHDGILNQKRSMCTIS